MKKAQNTIQESARSSSSLAPLAGGQESPPFRSFLATEMENQVKSLRDIYKEDVHKTHAEREAQLQQKRLEMKVQAGKNKLLLDYSKTALQQLEEQRQHTANILQQTQAHAESHRQQLAAEKKNAKALSLTKTAMSQLLDDLKRNK